jgi:hypothetical protein
MFREPKPTAESIIELIRTLPEIEQSAIAHSIKFSKSKGKRKIVMTPAERLLQVKRFEQYVSKQRISLPKGFRFDREEANRR